ncbi:MAG TPA: GAF domain-containing protein, partial [Candidatus Dormibacteraeota bacterium]|nr:GAF domain-containing protein [Candidatus Dormibacteraeota bacterium]
MATENRNREALIEAGLALSSELSLAVVLQRIVDLAAQITDARYGALGVVGPEGKLKDFVTTGIAAQDRRLIGRLPSGEGVLGALIHHPYPLRLEEISRDPRSVGFPANHPPMHTFLGAPVRAQGKVFGNIYLTEKRDGLQFTDEDERDLLVLATQAGIAVANATLYEEAKERQRWLEAFGQIGSAILSGAGLDLVLDTLVSLARELASADIALLSTPDPGGQQLIVLAANGQGQGSLVGTTMAIDPSLAGRTLTTGEPILVEDASQAAGADQDVVEAGHMGPLMVLPLKVRDRVLGTLSIARARGADPFSRDSLVLLQSFADQAAVALDYARARGDAERLAVMDDRERIAKELHDGIIQSLFAVGMGLQAAAIELGGPDSANRAVQAAARLDRSVTEIDRVIRDLRNYIFGLRPGLLADRQLDQALHALGDEVTRTSGLPVAVEVDPAVAAQMTG